MPELYFLRCHQSSCHTPKSHSCSCMHFVAIFAQKCAPSSWWYVLCAGLCGSSEPLGEFSRRPFLSELIPKEGNVKRSIHYWTTCRPWKPPWDISISWPPSACLVSARTLQLWVLLRVLPCEKKKTQTNGAKSCTQHHIVKESNGEILISTGLHEPPLQLHLGLRVIYTRCSGRSWKMLFDTNFVLHMVEVASCT